MMLASTACPDWRERLRAGRSLVPAGLVHTPAEAERAVKIFNKMRLPDVAGMPPLARAAGPWFRDIVRAIFGSLYWAPHADTGEPVWHRQLREVLILVPKKNAKTTLSAALMNTACLMSLRENVAFPYLAPTIDVAQLAYDQALGMIRADDSLAQKWKAREHRREVDYLPRGITQRIVTFDPKSATGIRTPFGLGDELHVMAQMAKASRVVRQVLGGLDPYPDGCWVWITTQSEEPPTGVFAEKLAYARRVRDGEIDDPSFLPVLYELPEEERRNWRNPKHWRLVNPNLGRSTSLAALERGYGQARDAGEHELLGWASQYVNLEIGMALNAHRWAGAEHWDEALDTDLDDLDAVLSRSDVATAGIDCGGADDLLSLTVIGRCAETRDWLVWSHSWCAESVLDCRKDIAPRLRQAEAAGELTIVPALGEDVDGLMDVVERLAATGLMDKLGVDPYGVAASRVKKALVARRLTDERGVDEWIVGIPQGWKLTSAIDGLSRGLAERIVRHGPNGLLGWAVGNLKVVQVGNGKRADKELAGSAKIDPASAMFNAAVLMDLDPRPRVAPVNPWEDESFTVAAE